MRILLVQADAAVAQTIELWLKAERMTVYVTDSGEDAVDLAKLYGYDLIIAAAKSVDATGFELIHAVRAAKLPTPILMLGPDAFQDRVHALCLGADDWLNRPFHKDELIARSNAIVRRYRGHAESLITVGDLVVDINEKTVRVDGMPMHLTAKEYAMLEVLALRQGMTITKEMFLNHMYGGMDEPMLKIIDVFICKLRRKLEAAQCQRAMIETIWGRGYVLKERPPAAALAA